VAAWPDADRFRDLLQRGISSDRPGPGLHPEYDAAIGLLLTPNRMEADERSNRRSTAVL
jgi:hypothetical protein